MMDQYADEDTDIEENLMVNYLDEEHADEDGSDIEAQINCNVATERDPDSSRDVDAFLRLPFPNSDGRFFAIFRHVWLQSIVFPLASVPPVKILKFSQLLNLREIENRRRQNTPLITTAPRKVKRFNIRYRRRQRRKTQNPSSAQPATATIETDSIEEVIIFSTRSLHAMALRNRKKVLLEWRVH
jgi:hypothetical protein